MGQKIQSSKSWQGKRFSLPKCPDRLWHPPSLLFNGYQGLYPWGSSGQGVRLATHLHLVQRLKNCTAFIACIGTISLGFPRLHPLVLHIHSSTIDAV